jgi:hypothetical protein
MCPDSIDRPDTHLHLDRYDFRADVIAFGSDDIFDFGRGQL